MAPEQRIKHQETLQQTESPLLCIFLFGPFRLEWHIPSADEGRAWDKRTSARSLLKLLLCAPDRQATRSQLTHLLWPDADAHHARESLRSAIKVLRQSLRLADGHTLLETEGEWLRLPAQSRLWVDADAVETLIGQARTTPDEAAAGALWTEAHALLVGEFLADEPANEWLTSPWIRQRRDGLLAARRQVVHQCADVLLRRGQPVQAETLLQAHVSRFPTDQDALMRLVKILIEQGRGEDARQVATRCTRALAKVGRQPSPQLHALLDQVPSAFLLPSVIQLPQTLQPIVIGLATDGQGASLLLPPREPLVSSERFIQTALAAAPCMDVATWFGARVNDLRSLGAFWNESRLSSRHLQAYVHAELERWATMTDPMSSENRISRRTALALLATLPTSLLAKLQSGLLTASIVEEFLAQSATSITSCYHLLSGDGLATVEYALPKYLPLLLSLAKQPSSYQHRTAYLAAQGCWIMGLVALHRLLFKERVAYGQQSVEFAQLSTDRSLLVMMQASLGNAWYNVSQQAETQGNHKEVTTAHAQMLRMYQEATQTITESPEEVPSVLHSKVFAGLAHAHAQYAQVQETLRWIGEARSVFSEDRENLPGFLSMDYGIYQVILFEGLTFLDLGRQTSFLAYHKKAQEKLAQIENIDEKTSVPQRFEVEITNQRALAAVRTGDLEAFERYFTKGAEGARLLASGKRHQEAITNWKAAQQRWSGEKRVLNLAEFIL